MSERYGTFAEQYLRSSQPPPISPEQVQCLALEGGGGKGNAYLGALYALDQLNVLPQLKVVAGSSAGAITALLLSLGMRPAEIYTFLVEQDFEQFFDPVSDAEPAPGAGYAHASGKERAQRRAASLQMRVLAARPTFWAALVTSVRDAVASARRAALHAALATKFRLEDVAFSINHLYLGTGAGAPPVPRSAGDRESPPTLQQKVVSRLADSWPDYATSLLWDMGIFSGEGARDLLARLIGARIGRTSSDPGDLRSGDTAPLGRSVTFAELDSYCIKHELPRLRVTGSEVCTKRVVIFSGDTTPQFPVADAVRISMGLPFLYKPYSLDTSGKGQPPCGVYVDGGVFSNLPLIAFDDKEAATALGLRLEVDVAEPVHGVLGFAWALLCSSVLAGESNITTARSQRCIRLDSDPLTLTRFEVDPDQLAPVTARSHLTTVLYLGRGSEYQPVDPATGTPLSGSQATVASGAAWDDLELSVRLRQVADDCVFDPERTSRIDALRRARQQESEARFGAAQGR